MLLVVFTVLSLVLLLVPVCGVANAKSPKPQDQVKNFIKAAAGLKVSKAASYWVTEESSNVISKLASVPLGTKISLSKLKLVVGIGVTADTSEVTATYILKVKLKGQKKAQQSNFNDTFNLKMVNGTWLISGTTMWEKLAELLTASAQTGGTTATPTGTGSSALNNIEDFFKNPPNFTVDLSNNTLNDPAVPSADMNMPTTTPGPIDINMNIDSNINVSVPTLTSPSTAGMLTSPSSSIPSIPTVSPTATSTATKTPTPTATATIPGSASCSYFSSIPSCSYVPEGAARQLCEQCKAGQ